LWKIDIFGQGELEGDLNNQIINNNLQGRITIHQPTKEIYNEYLHSDFYVLSSNFEGFGLVLIEAMSCGLPVVAFDCSYGPNEIISDKKDGFLVKNGNIKQLSEKMEWLMTHEAERTEMGIQARISAKRYEIGQIMSIWETLFKDGLK
jgi:glycosyltransferase involved in cell wall biosynthesis